MNASEIENRLSDYYDAWGTGEPAKVLEFFAADSVFEDLAFEAKFEGLDEIRSFAALTYEGVPDFRVEPHVVIVEGTRAAASWTMSGTHQGDLPGLPATGKSFHVRASSIIELRAPAILRITDYWNPIAFRKEVGLA